MRIGILTQPLHNNYGGLLQNYALQIILKRMGHDVWTINRVRKYNSLNKIASVVKRLAIRFIKGDEYLKIRLWQTIKEKNIISQHTLQFVKENIQTTHEVKYEKQMRFLQKNYSFDAYIVGSDQVWRPKYSPFLSNYFLNFIKNNNSIKKIAYAASFGTEEWEYSKTQTLQCSQLIRQFNCISVREESAISMCKKHFDVESSLVLDPTLLLDKEDYIELVSRSVTSPIEGNLFVYILDRDDMNKKIVNHIADKYNLIPFETMPEMYYSELKNKKDIEKCVFPPVEQWLRSFIEAEFVVTDSFHGTIFSILFGKPFITIANYKRGLTRFKSILKIFDLENRLILSDHFSSNIKNIPNVRIDFGEVNKKLELKKIESKMLLHNILINGSAKNTII